MNESYSMRSDSNAPGQYQVRQSSCPEQELEEPGTPLSHYLWILRRHRYKLILFVVLSVLGTYFFTSRLSPTFEATAVLEIDRQAISGPVANDSSANAINDVEQFLATQVSLIQSDAVFGSVADKYRVDRVKQFGDTVSRASTSKAPVLLKNLTVTRSPNTYLLLISYRSPDPSLAAEIANATAYSYLEYISNVRIQSASDLTTNMEKQIADLRSKVEASNAALLKLDRDGKRISSEKAGRPPSWQRPQLKGEDGQGQAELKKSDVEVRGLSQRADKVHQSTPKPQDVETWEARKKERFKSAVAETSANGNNISAHNLDYWRLRTEAETDTLLYEELVRKIRESTMSAALRNNSTRQVDIARAPAKPILPNKRRDVIVAFLFSTLLGLAVVAVSHAMDGSIRDPEKISQKLSTEVLGTLPMVRTKGLLPWLTRVRNPRSEPLRSELVLGGRGHLGARASTNGALTVFEESVRTLHAAILLRDPARNIRCLMVTSTTSGEGKTTTAANLAIRNAEQGYRTLLIDGDLRSPQLHLFFGVPSEVGLSSVLVKQTSWRAAITKSATYPNLDILTAGPRLESVPDLIVRDLRAIVEEAKREYCMLVIDSTAFANLAEPMYMSTIVDGVLVVSVAGQTNEQAFLSLFATLKRVGANALGFVMNKVTKDSMVNGHCGY